MNSFAGRSETLNPHFSELTVTSDMFNELTAHFGFFMFLFVLVLYCVSLLYSLVVRVKCKNHDLNVSR